MSRIYFHSSQAEAELRGSERAYAALLCMDLMMAVLGKEHEIVKWILPLIPPDSYVQRDPRGLTTYLRVDGKLMVENEYISTFGISLNTALVLGGDALRLLARLHGQSEIHCWVENHNRAWLAAIIERGLEDGIYRPDQGWDSVQALLRHDLRGPVVCSYSVCHQFPNIQSLPRAHPLALREDEESYEEFYEMPAEEQWLQCMKGLRQEQPYLELKPENWAEYRFYNGSSAFTILRAKELLAQEQRSAQG